MKMEFDKAPNILGTYIFAYNPRDLLKICYISLNETNEVKHHFSEENFKSGDIRNLKSLTLRVTYTLQEKNDVI